MSEDQEGPAHFDDEEDDFEDEDETVSYRIKRQLYRSSIFCKMTLFTQGIREANGTVTFSKKQESFGQMRSRKDAEAEKRIVKQNPTPPIHGVLVVHWGE